MSQCMRNRDVEHVAGVSKKPSTHSNLDILSFPEFNPKPSFDCSLPFEHIILFHDKDDGQQSVAPVDATVRQHSHERASINQTQGVFARHLSIQSQPHELAVQCLYSLTSWAC